MTVHETLWLGYPAISAGTQGLRPASCAPAEAAHALLGQTTTDVSAETNGAAHYEIAMMTQASTDIRVANLAYLTHQTGEDFYALAFSPRPTVK